MKVLVAAAGEIDHHEVILRLLRREIEHLGDGVRRLERRDDAFELGQELEGLERFVIGRRQEGDAAEIGEPRMLGADARVVEPGRDRVRLVDLPVLVHQQIGAVAVQHARPSAGNGGRVLAAVDAVSGSLDPVDLDLRLVEEGMEQAHGV